MFLLKIVFGVVTCITVINNIFVSGQNEQQSPPPDGQNPPQQQEPEAKEPVASPLDEGEQLEEPMYTTEPPPLEHHTFVALIEIAFTDGRKRTCTGTIIHSYVVITAAHCFVDQKNDIDTELTASFVIIGTKKMYDTGYENYLPIERVVTHPKYKGWTADIALVFTFASMTEDKPGNIIPIIGESALTPVDSNVTILSWGHCKDDTGQVNTRSAKSNKHPVEKKRICSSEEENHDSCEPASPKPLRQGSSMELEGSDEQDVIPQRFQLGKLLSRDEMNPTTIKSGATSKPVQKQSHVTMQESFDKSSLEVNKASLRFSATKGKKSKPLNPIQPNEMEDGYQQKQRQSRQNMPVEHNMDYEYVLQGVQVRARARNDEYVDTNGVPNRNVQRHNKDMQFRRNFSSPPNNVTKGKKGIMRIKPNSFSKTNKTTLPKYLRRSSGSKEDKLTIETFGFVNVQTCKKLVDRALPAIYSINTNEVVCYAAEEHYISDDDSGAPAIRQGHLVAVTLGGVECEGDHVAIGIKMNCFCSWIAENLPDKELNLKCCKNCCSGGTENKVYASTLPTRNKYLYK